LTAKKVKSSRITEKKRSACGLLLRPGKGRGGGTAPHAVKRKKKGKKEKLWKKKKGRSARLTAVPQKQKPEETSADDSEEKGGKRKENKKGGRTSAFSSFWYRIVRGEGKRKGRSSYLRPFSMREGKRGAS